MYFCLYDNTYYYVYNQSHPIKKKSNRLLKHDKLKPSPTGLFYAAFLPTTTISPIIKIKDAFALILINAKLDTTSIELIATFNQPTKANIHKALTLLDEALNQTNIMSFCMFNKIKFHIPF